MQPNPYDALLDDMQAEDERALRLRTSMLGAVEANPDEEAELRQLAQRYGLPVDGVRFTLPETRARARFDAVDYDTLARELPATSAVIADPALARLAHDDVDSLGHVERKLRQLGGGFQEAVGMAVHGTGALLGVAQRATARAASVLLPAPRPGPGALAPAARATPESLAGPSALEDGWLALGGSVKDYARQHTMVPAHAQTFSDQVAGGLGQLAGQAALYLLGGPVAGASTLYAQGASSMADKIAGDTATQGEHDLAVALGAGITGLTEKWALDKVLGPVAAPATNALAAGLARIGIAAASEGAQEMAESVLQDVVRQYTTNPEAEIELAQAVGEGGVGAAVGGLARSLVEAALHVRTRGAHRQQQAQQAETDAATLGELNEAAREGKLRQRDAQAFEQFADHAAEGGQLFVDARALMQSGLAEPLATLSPSVAAQVQAAAATGGVVAIPGAEYAARIAPSELAPALVEHLRTDPEGLSLAEARAAQAAEPEQLAQDFEQAAAQVEEEAARQGEQQAVRMLIQAELDAAGRFTPQANEAYAALTAAYYTRRAEMLGLSAEELYERRPLHVVAQGVLGEGVLHQALAAQPPKGWQHSTSGEDAARLWEGQGSAQAVFWTDLKGRLAQDAPALAAYSHSLDRSAINHIRKNHGDAASEAKRGQLAVTAADMARIPEVVTQYDDFRPGLQGKNGEKQVAFAKKVEDGVLVYVAGVAEGRQNLRAVSMRKYPPSVDARQILKTAVSNPNARNERGHAGSVSALQEGGQDGYYQSGAKTDAQRQFEETERAYGGRAAYDEAKVAGRTKLTYGQWVQVRTPNFLQWFGAWNARASATMQRRAATLEQAQQQAGEFVGQPIVNLSTGLRATVSKTNLGKMSSRKAGDKSASMQDHALAIANADQLFAHALLDHSHADAKGEPTIAALHHYVAPMLGHDGTLRAVKLTVKETTGPNEPNPIYSIEAMKIENPPSALSRVNPDRTGIHPQAGLSANVMQRLAAVNGEGVSKVVDPDTGEPMVVYHGTSEPDLTVFDLMQARQNADLPSFFFSTQREEAEGYGDNVIEAFLNIRNPVEKPDANMRGSEVRKELEAQGVDGTMVDDDWSLEYAAFHPTQIKSAISNSGAFDGNDPNILHQSARGFFNPETLQIALLKNADLSTWLHESGHFFFENDIALASGIVAAQREGASVTEGEQQLLADVSALLRWHGLQGSIDEQLLAWHSMHFEERRGHHERTAESFERYLMEGNAPSLELTPYFQKFRAWLLNVYQSIKDFLGRHPEAGQLSPEVRRVFDRMLAGDEQIRLAQQSRSMAPLFASPEEAGMSPEAFEAYHAQGEAAVASAAEYLQARALRDLQWTRNAHARELKKLQQQVRGLRAAARLDTLVQMQQEPLWRAWRFLTNRITEEDRLPPEPGRPKATVTLAPEHDSLLTAIAKLGGISRASAREHLGVHPDQFKTPSGVFGKPIFRKTGGLPADGMAEHLAEHGYLRRTEDGTVDLRDLEDLIAQELGGTPHYSLAHDWTMAQGDMRAGDQAHDVSQLGAGRLDWTELRGMGLPAEVLKTLRSRRMTAEGGLHPDIVAELFGFTSGDELVRALAAAPAMHEEVEGRVDAHLLQTHGELATPEALAREADRAIQNEARARMVATEANALARAVAQGKEQRKITTEQARALAQAQVARVQVRHLRPSLYGNLQARAAQAARKAMRAGDLATAAAEKRNELVQTYAARAAHQAREEVEQGVRYLRKFERAGQGLDAEYREQIETLLERFDLRQSTSLKAIDKRASLLAWVQQQQEAGLEPDISPELLDEARRQSYKTLTVEQFRGLVDTVRQIEHLGRLKHRLLTDRQQREFAAIRDTITDSIRTHAHGREASTRTATTAWGQAVQKMKAFGAAHIKAATWARIMDGGRDGGPVWEHFVRTANERADQEGAMRAQATQQLAALITPLKALGPMGGKGVYFPTLGRSLNRENRLAIALNVGNASNLQRLLGGEGWTAEQIAPVLQSLTAAEWQAVQGIWDHFEQYRPLIAAKERRVYGKEPQWIEATPLHVTAADGTALQLRGGYYPVKYDPLASQRAEEHADAEDARRQMQGAYTSATTHRSFTKARVEEVKGRPLLYSLTGVYSGVNDVIHDLAWHEWLIDANRLLRSCAIDEAIRTHWGPQAKQQLKTWVQDIAAGDKGAQDAADMALARLRQGVSVAGLGFNVISAAMQPLGFTQSVVRIGARWVGRGVARYAARPFALTREVNEKSAFMRNRSRTRFRELNELRNMVQDQSAWREFTGRYAYWMMLRVQQAVDVPTWQGAYEKALAHGQDEESAIALADQAVIDSQGGGETKDLSAIERGGPAQKLFTVYYSFMNTALNMGVGQAMSARTPRQRARLAADMLLLYTVPAVLGALLKDALVPGGDDDDESLARKLAAEQISYLMGLMVVVREFSEAGKMMAGAEGPRDYSGPAGVRVVSDALRFGQQASQGEFDDAFRKAAVNLLGSAFGLPAAQVNRSWTGAQALAEGETANPAALVLGHQR